MTDSNNLLRNIYKVPKPSDYICSPYADYNPVAKTFTKKKAAPDTVVVGGVTYHREKVKKTKVSPLTLSNVELTRAGALKYALNDWIEKYNPERLYDELTNGQGYEEEN
jgi:hypothetical protein